MVEFLKSDNFMKWVYILMGCTILAVGFVNNQEVIDLYKCTLSVCS